MTDVLDLQGVTIRRGTTTILDGVSWTVREGERWVVLGRNGAGKTTLLQVASGRMHPTSGTADLLGERMGRVDVFELRPRIGLASAALADRIPPGETVRDVVRTHWSGRLAHAPAEVGDAKSALQEWAQGQGLELPRYVEVERLGPDHAPRFTAEVTIKGKKAARGEGASKRAAEQAAAAALLSREGVWRPAK